MFKGLGVLPSIIAIDWRLTGEWLAVDCMTI